MDRIQASLLIPGNGDPIRDGVVVLDGPRISYAGPAAAAPATPGAVSHQAAAVMPGMWDCHGHFLGARVFDLAKMPLEPLALRVPDYAAMKLVAIADTHAQAVALAHERGVTIAMGTDIGLTGSNLPNSWGRNGAELPHLVTLGLTPLAAIEAATATAPQTLGPQAPRSGRLEAGYDADVITLHADPLADISVLADPARVTGVWTAGRQVKGAPPDSGSGGPG